MTTVQGRNPRDRETCAGGTRLDIDFKETDARKYFFNNNDKDQRGIGFIAFALPLGDSVEPINKGQREDFIKEDRKMSVNDFLTVAGHTTKYTGRLNPTDIHPDIGTFISNVASYHFKISQPGNQNNVKNKIVDTLKNARIDNDVANFYDKYVTVNIDGREISRANWSSELSRAGTNLNNVTIVQKQSPNGLYKFTNSLPLTNTSTISFFDTNGALIPLNYTNLVGTKQNTLLSIAYYQFVYDTAVVALQNAINKSYPNIKPIKDFWNQPFEGYFCVDTEALIWNALRTAAKASTITPSAKEVEKAAYECSKEGSITVKWGVDKNGNYTKNGQVFKVDKGKFCEYSGTPDVKKDKCVGFITKCILGDKNLTGCTQYLRDPTFTKNLAKDVSELHPDVVGAVLSKFAWPTYTANDGFVRADSVGKWLNKVVRSTSFNAEVKKAIEGNKPLLDYFCRLVEFANVNLLTLNPGYGAPPKPAEPYVPPKSSALQAVRYEPRKLTPQQQTDIARKVDMTRLPNLLKAHGMFNPGASLLGPGMSLKKFFMPQVNSNQMPFVFESFPTTGLFGGAEVAGVNTYDATNYSGYKQLSNVINSYIDDMEKKGQRLDGNVRKQIDTNLGQLQKIENELNKTANILAEYTRLLKLFRGFTIKGQDALTEIQMKDLIDRYSALAKKYSVRELQMFAAMKEMYKVMSQELGNDF